MEWFTEKDTLMLGRKNLINENIKNKKKMHQYTIYDGKMIGDFEGLYKNFKDPFVQTKKEKFETSKSYN